MEYILQDLYKVRELRERDAHNAVIRMRYQVEEATKEVSRCEKELIDFRNWRLKEEDRLYDEIMEEEIKVAKIKEIKAGIAKLRDQELDYQNKLQEAEKSLEEAKDRLEQAKLRHQKTIRELEKLNEHKVRFEREWKKEQERLNDLQMEESVRFEQEMDEEAVNF